MAAGALGLVGACARQGAPPGGPVDVRPPVVIATRPDTFDVGEGFEGPVRFEFDERISESAGGGLLEEAITVSPRTGEVSVSHGRTSLTVDIEGGFRPGLVYRVTLQPTIRDLFGNQLRDPFELVFSTGAERVETTLAGDVWDRITGRPVAQAALQAIGEDSLIHNAVADQDGIFAFRYLPPGAFRLMAFIDQNRDGEMGANETQGGLDFVARAGDTLFVDVPMLDPDSTPAALLRTDVVDSVTLTFEFDDFLEPSASLSEVAILIASDSADSPPVERLYHEFEYADYVDAVADSFARLDSIEAAERVEEPVEEPDTVAADTLQVPDSLGALVPPDSTPPVPVRQGPPRLARATGSDSALPGRPVLPGNRIVALLRSPAEPGAEFRVVMSGVVNIHGLPGGGGEVPLRIPLPVPDTVPPDPVPDTLWSDGPTVSAERDSSWWRVLRRRGR